MGADLLGHQARPHVGVVQVVLVRDDPPRVDDLRPLVLQSLFDGNPDPDPLIKVLKLLLDC